jgi:hypothetical protein
MACRKTLEYIQKFCEKRTLTVGVGLNFDDNIILDLSEI